MNEEIGEGGTSKIIEVRPGWVQKRLKQRRTQKNANLGKEKAVHQALYNIFSKEGTNINVVIPPLNNSNGYIMKKINTHLPLSDPDTWKNFTEEQKKSLKERIQAALNLAAKHGYYLRDVEGYLQEEDMKIHLLDFGRVYRNAPSESAALESGALIPMGMRGGSRRKSRRRRTRRIFN